MQDYNILILGDFFCHLSYLLAAICLSEVASRTENRAFTGKIQTWLFPLFLLKTNKQEGNISKLPLPSLLIAFNTQEIHMQQSFSPVPWNIQGIINAKGFSGYTVSNMANTINFIVFTSVLSYKYAKANSYTYHSHFASKKH